MTMNYLTLLDLGSKTITSVQMLSDLNFENIIYYMHTGSDSQRLEEIVPLDIVLNELPTVLFVENLQLLQGLLFDLLPLKSPVEIAPHFINFLSPYFPTFYTVKFCSVLAQYHEKLLKGRRFTNSAKPE
jgi:hypothetical protein